MAAVVVAGLLEEVLADLPMSPAESSPARAVSSILDDVVDLAIGVSSALAMSQEPAMGELVWDTASPSLSATPPHHPPPCSQDFAFYRGIEGTRGAWSPGEASSPPSPHKSHSPSPPLHLLASPSPPSEDLYAPNSPVFRRSPALAPSCGVALRPLTQAPPGKRPRLEDEGSQEKLEEELEEEQEGSDEDLALPLTFDSRADLLWKLKRADLLPGDGAAASQRPGAPRPTAGGDGGEASDAGRGCAGVDERTTLVAKVEPVGAGGDGGAGDGVAPRPGPGGEPRPGRPALLHRAPRLGLSRLQRRLPSIHEVTILQEEVTMIKEEATEEVSCRKEE